MAKATRLSPDLEISTSDPGDDVQRRFRYQAAYAALLSLQLLDDNSEFQEIYCEHHEDTLIKKKNNKFIGVQVKTRLPGKDPYKSNDKEIISSIVRFVELCNNYPDHFDRFVIATNHAFWDEEKSDPKNIKYIFTLAKNADGSPEKNQKDLAKFAKKILDICKTKELDISIETIINVLSKIEIDDDLPKFEDVELRLSQLIPEFYPESKTANLGVLIDTARELINLALQAGSLANTSALQIYFAYCENPKQKLDLSIIEGKRIERPKVHNVLKHSNSPKALLQTRKITSIENLPKDTNLIDLKMTKGNIPYTNIQLTKDHKYSLEHLLDTWLYKYGAHKTNERFDHLRVIIANECAEVFDNTYKKDEPFGQLMLNDVRKRLRDRLEKDKHLFFECEYEHLLGMTGILTEMCEVWWSDHFDIVGRQK